MIYNDAGITDQHNILTNGLGILTVTPDGAASLFVSSANGCGWWVCQDVVRLSLEPKEAAGLHHEEDTEEVVDTEDLSVIRKATDAEVVRQSKMSIEMKLADGHRNQAVDTATLPGWGEAIKMHIDEKFNLGTGQVSLWCS